jgi:hypothetical protein
MPIFDTLHYARRLQDVGVPREHAETHAAVLADMITDGLATKKDLDQGLLAVRTDMDQKFATFRADMDQKFATFRADIDQRFAAVDLKFAAVRADIQALDAKIDRVQDRLTVRLGGLIVAGVVVLAALQKLG